MSIVRKEFERVYPEEVGIKSSSIEQLLIELQRTSELHGLMMMRHGKVFFEGYWSPYAPGLRHALHSHSKTYYATGLGVAITNGLIDLDERIVDIFPDDVPAEPSEYLKELKVRHILSMSAGFEQRADSQGNWLRNVLSQPVKYKPGTKFRYNSDLSDMMAYIFEKKMGYSLAEYMRSNLYEKIGIDPDDVRCTKDVNGVDSACGGLLTKLEDNVRLMKLYLDHGICNGERILSEEYVREATSAVIDNTGHKGFNVRGEHDCTCGYGFQIWMCRHKGAYRADGHYGIYTIACPDEDMILAITETEYEKVLKHYNTLEAFWHFMDSIPKEETAMEPDDASGELAKKARCLSLPRPEYAPYSPYADKLDGIWWKVTQGRFSFDDTTMYDKLGRRDLLPGVSRFRLTMACGSCEMEMVEGDRKSKIIFAMDGTYHYGYREEPGDTFTRTASYAYWADDTTLKLMFRWLEGCYGTCLTVKIADAGLDITAAEIAVNHKTDFDVIKAVR